MSPTPWLALLFPNPAHACTVVLPGSFETQDDPSDTTPPSPPGTLRASITRGSSGSAGSRPRSSTCEAYGAIGITFEPAADEHGLAVGYTWRVVDGSAPDGLVLPNGPARAFLSGDTAFVSFPWIDAAPDVQEPFAFTLGVEPIDRAGNRGALVLVRIEHAGSTHRKDEPPTAL